MPKRRTNLQPDTKSKSRKNTTGKLKKWDTVEDIPMDAEDEFHAARDRILLEQEERNGYSDDGDEDEVFALKGMQDGSESEEEQEDHLDQEYYEIEEEEKASSTKKAKKEKKSKKVNGKSKTRNEEDKSDEEDDDVGEGWGQGKAAYYSSNADQLDSDDEEGHELEEQEATRLQTKNRQELQNEDFGLNDELEFEKRPEVVDILDPLPAATPPLSMDKQSLLRHLEKTNPESLALAKDWEDVVHQLHRTRLKIEKLEEEKTEPLGLGMIHLHYQTLLSYVSVLAFYLHMRASVKYAQRPALLQSHPIMQRLLTLKQSLQLFEDLDFAATEIDEEDYSDYMDMSTDDFLVDGEKVWRLSDAGVLEPNELDDLLQDAETPPQPKEKPPKKKRKVVIEDKKEPRPKPSFDLIEPQFVSSKSSSSHRQNKNVSEDSLDNYGDVTSLAAVDAADKSARRKNLRFHTSKIESASSRRKGARNQMVGGDDDIPYRERKKDRDARLVKEAVKRIENERSGDLILGGDGEEEKYSVGEKRTRLDEEDDSPDEYYELVQKKSKDEKARKKADYDEAHGLPRIPIEEVSSGPRSLTRAILKNKGLTPQRPKAVRNPRVKKRQKFDKAKRKVSSQKALYKGGLSETKGKYEGEKSGISKVVKSVRLG